MIEWVESRNNLMIPKQNGVLLCSSIDPLAEAKKWVEKCGHNLDKYEVIFVFGLAGGFHIKQLAHNYPEKEIIVIEAQKELEKELMSRRGRLPENVTILSGMSLEEIKQNVFFRAGIKSIFRVLKYPTSCRMNSDYFIKIEDVLVARDLNTIKYHLEGRPQLRRYFDELDLKGSVKDESNVTILDIERAIRKRNKELDRDSMIFLSLRELVK